MDLDRHRRAFVAVLFGGLSVLLKYQQYTRMTANGLARVFAPNVLDAPSPGGDNMDQFKIIGRITTVLETMLTQYESIFKELSEQYPIIQSISEKKAADLRSKHKRATHRAVPAVPAPVVKEKVTPMVSSSDETIVRAVKKQKSELLLPVLALKTSANLVRCNTYAAGFQAPVDGDENTDGNSPRKTIVSASKRGPAAALNVMTDLTVNL